MNDPILPSVMEAIDKLYWSPSDRASGVNSLLREILDHIKKKLKAKRSPVVVITILGPNLSVNLPEKMTRIPCNTKFSDKAPEVIALVQPNSSNIGLKKTP